MHRPSFPLPTWTSAGGGRLAVSGRPKLRAFEALEADGCTHVVTLQSERENARAIEDAASRAGLAWIWQPFDDGRPPPGARDAELAAFLDRLAAALGAGGSLLVHCSAGIHRTGMIAYALLRWTGLDGDAARAALAATRQVTADGVGAERLAWADRFVARRA